MAGNLIAPLAKAAIGKGRNGWAASYHSCFPLPGVYSNRSPGCREFNDRILGLLDANPTIRDVIVAAFWARATDGQLFAGMKYNTTILSDDQSRRVSVEEDFKVFERSLERLRQVVEKHNARLVVVASVPEAGWDVAEMLARKSLFGAADDLSPLTRDYRLRQARASAQFTELEREGAATVVRTSEILCPSDRCLIQIDGLPLYTDAQHLNGCGALLLEPLFERIM